MCAPLGKFTENAGNKSGACAQGSKMGPLMSDELARVSWERSLERQLSSLIRRYFPDLEKTPEIWVVENCSHGPAWLNLAKGAIFVDQRVAGFQSKTTKILILHELIRYSLFLSDHPDPDNEQTPEFQRELRRLINMGAYAGLL